jgi:hypothetical protein
VSCLAQYHSYVSESRVYFLDGRFDVYGVENQFTTVHNTTGSVSLPLKLLDHRAPQVEDSDSACVV